MPAAVELWTWDPTVNHWVHTQAWPNEIIKVGRGPIGSTTVRHVAAGLVVAGPHDLYWVSCNAAAGNSLWELTDAIAALAPVLIDHFHVARGSMVCTFDPPIEFGTGIWIERLLFMTSLVLCYV